MMLEAIEEAEPPLDESILAGAIALSDRLVAKVSAAVGELMRRGCGMGTGR